MRRKPGKFTDRLSKGSAAVPSFLVDVSSPGDAFRRVLHSML